MEAEFVPLGEPLSRSTLVIPVLLAFLASSCASGGQSLPQRERGSKARKVTLSAVGDVLLYHMEMGDILEEQKKTMNAEEIADYPFGLVKKEFKGITVGNLEGTITDGPIVRFKPKWMKFYFKMPPTETVAALKAGGFDLMSLANNHIKDAGRQGVAATMAALDKAGIAHVGAGMNLKQAVRPLELEQDAMKVVFLSFNLIGPRGTHATSRGSGAAKLDVEGMAAAVRAAGEPGTTIVVSLHWGIEQKKDLPLARPTQEQRLLARRLIDEGAALILGSHSHSVSEFEEYRHGLIAYSLGNFVFSGNRSSDHHSTVILQAELRGPWVRSWTLVPVYMEPPVTRYRPRIMDRKQGIAFLRKVLFNPTRKHRRYY